MAAPSPFTTASLIAELQADPLSLGYADFLSSGDDNAGSDVLNTLRSGGGFLVYADPVPPSALFDAIDPEDYTSLTTTDLARLQTIFTLAEVNLSESSTLTKVLGVFPNGSPSVLAITALQHRAGSRAEVLWGPGTVVTPNEVNEARENM